MVESVKKRNACESPAGEVRHTIFKRIKFKRCPGAFFDHNVARLYEVHHFMKLGMLPYSGGLYDQPNKIIEAFGVIDEYIGCKTEFEQEQQKAKDRALTRGRK